MNKFILLIIFTALALQTKAQTISDADGNTYNTVTIGTQTWMKENLKTTKYNDGTTIPIVTGDLAWENLTTPAYCWINNDIANKDTFGALYNWYTINTQKLCPTNWHVPTDDEWILLADFLGGDSVAGGKLKEAGTTHWFSPNTGADNSTGFTGLSQDSRDSNGPFNNKWVYVFWWSSTNINDWGLTFSNSNLLHFNTTKTYGNPVRCLKDDIDDPVNTLVNPADNVIYPNPATDKLYIKNNKPSNATITVYDMQGKQLINIPLVSDDIDISGLAKGMYMVKITFQEHIMMEKMIKE